MMKRLAALIRRLWKLLAGGLVLLLLAAWMTGAFKSREAAVATVSGPGVPLPADAVTALVRTQHLPQRIEAVGSAVSDNTVQLSARVNAYVQEVLVHAGDAVERGQVLIRLDDRDLRAQAEAAQVEHRRAQTEYERIRRLHETQAATDQQRMAAEAAFHMARAGLERSEVALTFTEIRAPFDGRITDRHAETGMLANPGQVLLHLYDPARMRLDVPVPVRLVDYLAVGDAVELQLERPAGRTGGRVHRVVSEIDARSRTQTVQVLLDDLETPPLPGTFGRLWIPASPVDQLLVPRSAMYRVGQLELVQVVQDSRVVRRLVRSGAVRGEDLEILSGLTDGETLLVHPVKD